MKLFLKAIALAAKDPKFQGYPRQELNRLIDVAESSGLTVWHDNFCFKSTFWDWGNRETGTINWGGYGSSYRPANESYFKFQYLGDTATMNYGTTGKLTTCKGAKPLDAVKALVLPEGDADGSMLFRVSGYRIPKTC